MLDYCRRFILAYIYLMIFVLVVYFSGFVGFCRLILLYRDFELVSMIPVMNTFRYFTCLV